MIPYPFNVLSSDAESLMKFPLSPFPYNSRVEMSEITNTNPKNYVMIGFRPGFPLQASELNEMQDINLLNQNLTTSMIHLWSYNKLNIVNEDTAKIYGPGWVGTTPLWPESFDSEYEGPTTSMVEYAQSDQSVTLTIKEGWYLVHVRSSGLKHWIYINEDIISDPIQASTTTKYVGLKVYYTEINVAEDPGLYDNSSTSIPVGTPAGANRIKLNINMEVGITATDNYYEPLTSSSIDGVTVVESFSPIVKINSDYSPRYVRYMNNRNVPLG